MTVKILISSKCYLQFPRISFALFPHYFLFIIYFIHYNCATILITWKYGNIFVIPEWFGFIVSVIFGMVNVI